MPILERLPGRGRKSAKTLRRPKRTSQRRGPRAQTRPLSVGCEPLGNRILLAGDAWAYGFGVSSANDSGRTETTIEDAGNFFASGKLQGDLDLNDEEAGGVISWTAPTVFPEMRPKIDRLSTAVVNTRPLSAVREIVATVRQNMAGRLTGRQTKRRLRI